MKHWLFYVLMAGCLSLFLYFAMAYEIDIKERPERPFATARCRDQTLSYSRHRSGTCSYHGGVASWGSEDI